MGSTIGLYRAGFALGAALLVAGCPNPNTYTTPRTAGSGRITNSIAPEVWGFSFKDPTTGGTDSLTVPVLPTYTLRIGIGDPVDIGLRIANMTSVGGDLKWNFLRSRGFDMAIDPGFQYFRIGGVTTDNGGTGASVNVTYVHVPLLLGFNISRGITIVATPGVGWGLVSENVSSGSQRDEATSATGVMARFGIGADFRVNSFFAVHPELTALRFIHDEVTLYMFGVGLNFGAMPNYDDVDGTPLPVPTPTTQQQQWQ